MSAWYNPVLASALSTRLCRPAAQRIALPVMELRVADNPDQSRYEIAADGEIAGFITYKLSSNDIAFLHTETEERFRGMGIAGHLVQASLDSTRERGLAVLPYCPYVRRRWIGEHLDYAELVPAQAHAEFGL
jgi:predicted GNAT family acetyltransferase